MDLTPQEIGAVVRQAVATIENHGWVQGRYGDRDYGYCAVGALRAVAGSGVMYQQISRELCMWMRSIMYSEVIAPEDLYRDMTDTYGPTEWPVTDFNDSPGRTKEEVLLHMNKFADEMDPQWI